MNAKTKLERLERAVTERGGSVFRCPVCGETFKSLEDLALALLAHEWLEATGAPARSPNPALEAVLGHRHDALREEILQDVGASLKREEVG